MNAPRTDSVVKQTTSTYIHSLLAEMPALHSNDLSLCHSSIQCVVELRHSSSGTYLLENTSHNLKIQPVIMDI